MLILSLIPEMLLIVQIKERLLRPRPKMQRVKVQMRYIIVLLKSKFKINSYGLKHGVDFEVVKGTGIIFAVVSYYF